MQETISKACDIISKLMNLLIIKVSETIFEGEAESVTLPGLSGQLTVMKDHEPLVTPLKEGKVTYTKKDGQTEEIEIEKGFLEINKGEVNIIL